MKTNYVLIDFESVQPADVTELDQDHFNLIVFVGSNQPKVPIDLAAAMQKMGDRAKYVKISGSGKNALDFHITFYIGTLAAQDPHAFFHIISHDKGFDPLIQHLKTLKIYSARSSSIGDIPLIKSSGMRTPDGRAALFIAKLERPLATRPRALKTLKSAISTLFQKQLSEEDLDGVVAALQQKSFLSVVDGKVVYATPAS
ncbi:MAG: PIN domain-containing protein [Burkholderiaceae bacterium]